MAKKSLKVDRKKFEGIVQSLLQAKPLKRSKIKVAKKKPDKLIHRRSESIIRCAMQGRLGSQRLKDLSDELAALTKQQSDARLTEVFIRMPPKRLKPSISERNASPRFTLFFTNTTPSDRLALCFHQKR
jgi:hypothetical protein